MLYNIIKRGNDKLNKYNQTNKVYQLKCKNCNATYVGETKREVGIRISEHVDNSSLEKYSVVTNN